MTEATIEQLDPETRHLLLENDVDLANATVMAQLLSNAILKGREGLFEHAVNSAGSNAALAERLANCSPFWGINDDV